MLTQAEIMSRFGGWPIAIAELAEAPAPLGEVATSELNGERPELLLLVPRDLRHGAKRRESVTASRLLVLAKDRLIVFKGDEDDQPAGSWVAPLDRILAIEWGQILLFSWVRFIVDDGKGLSSAYVRYNTVGYRRVWRLLVEVLSRMSSRMSPMNDDLGLPETQAIPKMSLKFTNALHSQVPPDDHLRCLVYQPKEIMRRWGVIQRVCFPQVLLSVTSHHVLFMQEDERQRADEPTYGTVATYLPLSKISGLQSERAGDAAEFRAVVGAGPAKWGVGLRFDAGKLPALQSACDLVADQQRLVRRSAFCGYS